MLQTMMGVYQSYNRIESEIRAETSADFLHFLALVELELDNSLVLNVENQRVLIENPETKRRRQIVSQNNKIYITPGHQPLLYNVESWSVAQVMNHLSIVVTFTNGDVHHGLISIRTPLEVQLR